MHLSNTSLLRAAAASCKPDPNGSPQDGVSGPSSFSVILRQNEDSSSNNGAGTNSDEVALQRYTPTSNRVLLSMGQMRPGEGGLIVHNDFERILT